MKSEVLVQPSPAVYMAKQHRKYRQAACISTWQEIYKSLLFFIALGIYNFGSRVNNQRNWIYHLFCNKLLYHLLL